jgi:hypothetical protein
MLFEGFVTGKPSTSGDSMRRAGLLVLSFAITGCATARLTAYRDPAFPDRQFDRLAVFALGMPLQQATAIEEQVCSKVSPAPCVPGKRILPPTRTYTQGELEQFLGKADIDGVLLVVLGDDQTISQYLGTVAKSKATAQTMQTWTATAFGNMASVNSMSQTTATAQTVVTPVYGYQRTAHAGVALYERTTGKVAWRGEMSVSGNTQYSVSDEQFIKAAASEIAGQLKAAQLVP